METPISSTSESVISTSKISKSLSSGNIYNKKRDFDKSNNNNINRNSGSSGNSNTAHRMLRVGGKCYSILNCIGKGGSSCVIFFLFIIVFLFLIKKLVITKKKFYDRLELLSLNF